MHKNDPVCSIIFDSRGYVNQVPEVIRSELLPCMFSEKPDELKFGIQRWLLRRTSGRNRNDYTPLRTFYGNELFTSKYKASLFDCYWILPPGEDKSWDDISLFRNWDSEDDEYFGILNDPENTGSLSRLSPNLTLPGNEHRFWYMDDNKLGIITESAQMDVKKVKMAAELGIEELFHPRKYLILCGTIFSFHPVEFSEKLERIPLDYYYDAICDENLSRMENLGNCCKELGIEGWKKYFGAICKFDDATGNKERELSSIGVLRDADTLTPVRFEKI